MPNSTSKLSLSINDQYFTPVDTAKWCFETVQKETGWDFKGTALEPAVGQFAFVKAAEELGLDLKWTTNDLFPTGNRRPDFEMDFKEFEGSFDYVITNPPFGSANTLARMFMKRGLSLADRVMMLLPKGARRLGFQDSMPRNAERIFDCGLEDETFVTSTGEIKTVKTCIQAWRTTDQTFPLLRDQLDLRDDLFSYRHGNDDDWDANLDIQVVRWGSAGRVVPKEKHRKSGALMSVSLKNISEEQFIEIQNSLDFSDFDEMCSGAPAFDVPVWVHRFNLRAVELNLLPEKVK
jgi:hypothetical protein